MKKTGKKLASAGIAASIMAPITAFATDQVGLAAQSLAKLILGWVKWVGIIGAIIAGIVFAIGWFNHENSQKITGLLCFIGAFILIFLESILTSLGISL